MSEDNPQPQTEIESIKAALELAGVKFRANASDETLRTLFAENKEAIDKTGLNTETVPVNPDEAPASQNPAGTVPPVETEVQPESETFIPPMPPMNSLLGDKTPEIVAWYREYKPEEYAERYKGRKVNGQVL